MAIEPGYRNGQKGYYTDSSRNTFVVDDQYGPQETTVADQPGSPSYNQMMQSRIGNLSPYTMTQDDNMAISDNSDPQGEEEARMAVQQALAGPQRGLIGNAISRLFG